MGSAYDELEQYDKAIEAYIAIKPDKDEAYYNMGIAYSKLGQYEKAIEAYKKAISINPQLTEHAKKQDWSILERWINNLADSNKKTNYKLILNKLKGNDVDKTN